MTGRRCGHPAGLAGPCFRTGGLAALAAAMMAGGCAARLAPGADTFEARRQGRRDRVQRLMQRILAPPKGTKFGAFPDKVDLHFAMASLWLGQRIPEGNQAVRRAYAKVLQGTREVPGGRQMTPALAYTQKWRLMRLWLRLYFFFADKGTVGPGRLDADARAKMLDLFWNYAAKTSTVHRARPQFVWHIQNSENHDMMDLSNAFLCVQALKNAPAYRDRKLPDGHTPQEHYDAWNPYYTLYCDQRARHGLFVEISPTYGKYFLPELMNIGDLAEDPVLRKKVHMLLTVVFADWAVDQIGGIRGGGKTRSYQGGYSRRGRSDSWNAMIRTFLDTAGNWENSDYENYTHNTNLVLGTSSYRMPDVVMDLALNPEARGRYVYTSLRPAKSAPKPANAGPRRGYWMDAADPRCLRYSYVTPDYILGGFMLDPSVGYAAINSQNRWSGIVFATGPDARVFPQCVGLRNGKTYNQHLAVQHENVMIVQKNRKARQAGDMRVYFAPGMKKRFVERDGWVAGKEGRAYVAVRPLGPLAAPPARGYIWDDANWLRCRDEFAPVVLVAGLQSKHRTLDEFLASVRSHEFSFRNGLLTYSFPAGGGGRTTLTMDIETQKRLPQINGRAVDLRPRRVFDCPYLRSKRGSGVVTITFRGRKLVLDFGKTAEPKARFNLAWITEKKTSAKAPAPPAAAKH